MRIRPTKCYCDQQILYAAFQFCNHFPAGSQSYLFIFLHHFMGDAMLHFVMQGNEQSGYTNHGQQHQQW
jgi:hypothetical protein